MADEKPEGVTFGAPPEGVTPVQTAATPAPKPTTNKDEVTFGAPPQGQDAVAPTSTQAGSTPSEDYENQSIFRRAVNAVKHPSWEGANTGLATPNEVGKAWFGETPEESERKATEITASGSAYHEQHPYLDSVYRFFEGTRGDIAKTASSFTSPTSVALTLASGVGQAAEAFNSLRLLALGEGPEAAAQVINAASKGRVSLPMATQVAKVIAASNKVAKVSNAVGKGAKALQTAAGAGFGAQGVAQAASADYSTPEGIQQGLMGASQAALGAAGTIEPVKTAIRRNLAPKTTTVGKGTNFETKVPTRSDSFAAKQLAGFAPKEELQNFSATETHPAIAQGVGDVVKDVAGTTGKTVLSEKDPMGILGHTEELKTRAQAGFKKVDEWSGGKLSEYQDQADAYRGDFTGEGREKFNEAMDAQDSLYDVYAKKHPNEAADIDQNRRDWRVKSNLERINKALGTAIEAAPTTDVDYNFKHNKQFANKINQLIRDVGKDGKNSFERAGFTPEHVQALKDFGRIITNEANLPRFGTYIRAATDLALGGLGLHSFGVGGGLGAAVMAHAGQMILGKLLTTPEGVSLLNSAIKSGAPVPATASGIAAILSKSQDWVNSFSNWAGETIGKLHKDQSGEFKVPFTGDSNIELLEQGQGGHAGNTVASEEEINRPGQNYLVNKSGSLTYHGKSFAPEEAGRGQTHVTVLPDGTYRVNAGNELNPIQQKMLEAAVGKKLSPEGSAQASPKAESTPYKSFTDVGANLSIDRQAEQQALQESREGKLKGKSVVQRAQEIKDEIKSRTLQSVAEDYNKQTGRAQFDYTPVGKHPQRAAIADAYDEMEHNPNDPKVKASYDAMKQETKDQYDHLKNSGYTITPSEEDPYKSYAEMERDVKQNKHLSVWLGGKPPADHPMSEVEPETGLTYNTLFRAVHDIMGHVLGGHDFSELGEENAYNLHRQAYSHKAVPAVTTETRGQTSNYFKHNAFPEQKANLLPEQFHGEQPSVAKSLVDKYGTTNDPTKAGFITAEGDKIPIGSREHDRMIMSVSPDSDIKSVRSGLADILNNENMVRVRVRPITFSKTGKPEVSFSIPENVTPEQVSEIKSAVKKLNGPTVVIEQAKEGGKYVRKDEATPADVQSAIDEIKGEKRESFEPEAGSGYAARLYRNLLEKRATAVQDMPASEILSAHNQDGGVTFDPVKGNLKGAEGYAVSVHPERTQQVQGELTEKDVKSFIRKNADLLEIPGNVVGTWNDGKGTNWLDVTRVVDDEDTAMQQAKNAKQLAIYDLKNGEVIDTQNVGGQRVAQRSPIVKGAPAPHDPTRTVGLEDVLRAGEEKPKYLANLAQKTQDGIESMSFAPEGGDESFDTESEAPEMSPKEVVQSYVRQAADHIKALYKAVPDYIKQPAMKWYETANKMTGEWAKERNLSHEQTAAITAVLSPQNPWEHNINNAKRIMDIYRERQNQEWTPEMSKEAAKQLGRDKGLDGLLEDIHFKKLGELTSPAEKGKWIQLYDMAHGAKTVDAYDPLGNRVGLAKTDAGQTAKNMWFTGDDNLAKAVSIIEDGSMQNINAKLGQAHKVRNFYNNIIDPWSRKGDVTVDTHAVGAAQFHVVGTEDPSVVNNFGRVKNGPNGLVGTYALNAEAYRTAAKELSKELGVQIRPNQVQSVTWEGIKNLFKDKAPELKAKVSDIWKEYQDGTIDVDTARNRIIEASGGFGRPAWLTDSGVHAGEEAAANKRAVPSSGVRKPDVQADSGTGRNNPASVSTSGRGAGTGAGDLLKQAYAAVKGK